MYTCMTIIVLIHNGSGVEVRPWRPNFKSALHQEAHCVAFGQLVSLTLAYLIRLLWGFKKGALSLYKA